MSAADPKSNRVTELTIDTKGYKYILLQGIKQVKIFVQYVEKPTLNSTDPIRQPMGAGLTFESFIPTFGVNKMTIRINNDGGSGIACNVYGANEMNAFDAKFISEVPYNFDNSYPNGYEFNVSGYKYILTTKLADPWDDWAFVREYRYVV